MAADSLRSRVKNAWNAFFDKRTTDDLQPQVRYNTNIYSYRPDRTRFTYGNERSIINAIYNRIAIDVSQIDIKHIIADENGRYIQTVNDSLNYCLTVEANKDQTSRAFFQGACQTMFDKGVVALVPVDTTISPLQTSSYDILSIRAGEITEWMPDKVKVKLYNDRKGIKEEIVLPKGFVAIVENPFYSVMNEPNSTLKRLIRKLNLLDAVDEQSSSGKLDLIIQLPYTIKTAAQRVAAETRRRGIEEQLQGGKYGIAYIDGTEHVTQLNRPAENNLHKQIEYLTTEVYNQLGVSKSIFEGTASEEENEMYYVRVIEPIISAITTEMYRKYLTRTARTQGHTIRFFRDPFKLVPPSQIAEMADKFTRNEILSSNEFRGIIGFRPSNDPAADELRNANLNKASGEQPPRVGNEGLEENKNS